MRNIVAALSLAFLPMPAVAASPISEMLCAPKGQLEKKLEQQFGSHRQGVGVRDPEQVMELWADDQGDWTLVVSYAHGLACIVAMGEHWQALAPPEPA